MAVDRGELEDVVNTDMNISVPYNVGIFLYSLLAFRQGLCLVQFVSDKGNVHAWPDFM